MNQIAFMLSAVRKPTTVPLSFISLTLIGHTSNSFISTHVSQSGLFHLAAIFAGVRNIYELKNVRNKVVDGTERFPENQQSLSSGVSVEFRYLHYLLLHVGVSEAYGVSGMYHSITLIKTGVLSGMFHSGLKLVSFA